MLQLYFDFSGYSDMAIGLGLMFGFHFEENFNYPYISRSVGEFWRRWHISLGSWFRDYLFMPVSRSEWLRKLSTAFGKKWGTKARRNVMAIVPTLVVWALTGIWHGANWNFLVFGCWYGVLMSLDVVLSSIFKKWMKVLHINKDAKWFHGFQIVRTLLLVLIADVFFRSDSMGQAVRYMGCLFGLCGNSFTSRPTSFLTGRSAFLLLVSAVLAAPTIPWLAKKLNRLPLKLSPVRDVLTGVAYTTVYVVAIAFTVTSQYNPFIYFNF